MVDGYGEQIEFDLQQMGLDLIDFFRGRYSWRKLANMISRLPATSHTIEAMADDDEIAEMTLDQPDTPDRGPRLSEYSPVVARLDVLADRIAELISLTVHVNSTGNRPPPKVKPAKRPETALIRAKRRRSERRMNALMDEVKQAQDRFASRHATDSSTP